VLDQPRYGCINIHGSRLPRWRGAAPVQRAIEAGDRETAIAIMQMDAGLDTGGVLLSMPCAIAIDETSGSLFEKLTALAARTIVDAVAQLPSLSAVAQPTEGASYAKKISKLEANIDWQDSALTIERRLRAFDPAPGCESTIGGDSLKIWRGRVVVDVEPEPEDNTSRPAAGTIVSLSAERLAVQCGSGTLEIVTVQKPGGKRMAVADFLRGATVQLGWRFI
jgi:methionyl-tRNA formyltransferase